MAKANKKRTDSRRDPEVRVAGGFGVSAAVQEPEALLRRAVMANLLWEDQFYMDGQEVGKAIMELVAKVAPDTVAAIAREARDKQKLRHVPLLLARELARLHYKGTTDLLYDIIQRADELSEFVALYWQDGKCPLSAQVKRGLARAFDKFDAYQFAKYNRDEAVRLRDVMFLVHPRPAQGKETLYRQIAEDELPTPDTWEVALSAGKDKKTTWERLLAANKLGALAFIRNLRNMEESSVDRAVMETAFEKVNPARLLPVNFVAAAREAPRWEKQLETLMLKCLAQIPKLPGSTILIVDVSGSMNESISNKSKLNRLDAAGALAMLAVEICEQSTIYATAGNDSTRIHATKLLPTRRGFAVMDVVRGANSAVGGGGIFTRQCLEYVREHEREQPDRIFIFSDSQDCDLDRSRLPQPFGKHNYIVDVSAHTRGIAYKGLWTAEISGWSENYLAFVSAMEGTPSN